MKLLFSIFFLCFRFNATADSWTQKASYPGAGQELPISFSIGDKGYAGCGSNASDFWEYDPVADTWTQKANVPGATSRRGGVGFSIGNKGYVGTGDAGVFLNDFYEYDPATNIWTAKASMSVGRGYGLGFSIGDKGYIGGGYQPTFLTDFWEYDPASNAWTQKSDLPSARRQSVGFSILGKGYIATGYDGNYSYTLFNDIWEYDVAANTWTQKADMPAPGRVDARAFVICDKGYVMTGGEFPFFDDLWQFDPVTNAWTQKLDVPGGPRDDGATFTIGNKGYFGLGQVGGYTNATDFWEYTPDDICNMNIPNFSATDTTICEKFCINFFDSSANNPTAWLWIFPGGVPATSTSQNPTDICYDTPGSYDVTLITTTANGNDTVTLLNYITVFPTPPFPTITQVGYTLTSSAASSYQWQFNSIDIPGATNQSYTILQTGYYTVVINDANGCVNSVTTYVLIDGVDELNDDGISIYPNPSSGNFIVEFSYAEASENRLLEIEIANALGQKVFSSAESLSIGTAPSLKKEIDLTQFADGVYYLTLQSENIFLTRKMMIAR